MRSINFVLLILALYTSIFAQHLTVVQQNNDEIILEWNAPLLEWQTVQIDGQQYDKPICGSLIFTSVSGAPALPFDAFTTILQDSFTIQIVDSIFSTSGEHHIQPAASFSFDQVKNQVFTFFKKNPAIYKASTAFPRSFVSSSTAQFKNEKHLRLQLNPIKYYPTSGAVEYAEYLRIRIRKITRNQPLYKKTAIAPVPQSVKIKLLDEGVYKIPLSDLQAMGVPVTSLKPKDFRLTNKDENQPIQFVNLDGENVGSESEILFFCERLRGESEFYHDYSDTNVYWLTWQGSGLEYTPLASVEADTVVKQIRYLAHFEEDNDYYHGDDDPALHNSFEMDGEGWVWHMFIDPYVQVPINFDLPGLVKDQETAQVYVRVRGETMSYQENDHHIQIVLNDSIYIDDFFQDRDERIFTFQLPSQQLKEKDNRIIIKSIFQSDELISRFYLDWFKVDYNRRLTLKNGLLAFNGVAGEKNSYHISNLPTNNVTIFDTENNLVVQPFKLDKEWTAQVQVQSAGMTDGNLANFYVNNALVYKGTRGISIITMDPLDGVLLGQKTFDTHGAASASDSLAIYLDSLPQGTIILSAIGDEGTRNLTESAKAEFRALGSEVVDSLQYRDNWAGIYRKGEGLISEKFTSSGSGIAQVTAELSFNKGGDYYTLVFNPAEPNGHYVVFDMDSVKTPTLSWVPESNVLSTQSDYIVITHAYFEKQARQLADYRTSFNGFAGSVVLVEDIYNQFSDGIKSPYAIRDFLKAAREQWEQTRPRFVVIFGDASWDPKLNNPDSKRIDYVPTLGNPVSDALLVCLDGDNDVIPDLSIGRIPVKTQEEADAAVEKIMTYEAMPSEAWKKSFLMISGGFDDYEQRTFDRQSQELSEHFVDASPVFGDTFYISKKTQQLDEGEYSYQIVDLIDQGMLWVNFIGHAGSRTWELMFHNPDIENLSNNGRFPFISSMTCHTGRFGSPVDDSFGEHFLLTAQKGAIGFWGTSGWGYSYEDYQYLRQLYPTALQDSLRYMGDIILETKYNVWRDYGLSEHYINLILQYNLLGDPAIHFALPEKPDFAVHSNDITINPVSPFESDSTATIRVILHNYGLSSADSVDLELDIFAKQSRKSLKFTKRVPPIANCDTLHFEWPLKNMVGDVEIALAIDQDDNINEVEESNNQVTMIATVLSSNIQIISPFADALIPNKDVHLYIENPSQKQLQDLAFEFQLDTTGLFNSTLLQVSPGVNAKVIATDWHVGDLLPGINYYWRVRDAESELDSDWITTIFSTSSHSEQGWAQNSLPQLSANPSVNLAEHDKALNLDRHEIEIRAESAGVRDGNFARIFIDRESIITEPQRGINMVAIDTTCFQVLDVQIFDTHLHEQAAFDLAAFITDLPDGTMICAGIKDEGSRSLNESAYQALESIGSSLIRQVEYRDSWAIIGIKGASRGSAIETHSSVDDGDAVAVTTRSGHYLSGTLTSPLIGPALAWHACSAEVETAEQTDVTFTVLGYATAQADADTLYKNKALDNIHFETIDAAAFPFVRLHAHLHSSSILKTPVFQSWQVLFTPAPDLAVSPQVFSQSVDSLLVGQTLSLYFDVYNIGLSATDSVTVKFEQSHPTLGRETFAVEKLAPIAEGKYKPVKKEWQAGVDKGVKQLFISIDPDNNQVEMNETNNSLVTSVYVHEDTLKPNLLLTFDDVEIFDGDLVSAAPEIIAKIYDNSPQAITDTNQVTVYLDGEKIDFSATSALQLQAPQQDESGLILFTPELDDGKHEIDIVVADASRNEYMHHIEFKVESDLAIYNLLNYPNPFQEDTAFRFELSQPAEISIQIYTVAGRLIRRLQPGYLSTGYQTINWDGLDMLGDRLANGTYLYKINAKGESETVSKISKLIVMK